MKKSLDFWPHHIDASPVLLPDPARAERIKARRGLLEQQAELIISPRYPSFLLRRGVRQVREGVDEILSLIEKKAAVPRGG